MSKFIEHEHLKTPAYAQKFYCSVEELLQCEWWYWFQAQSIRNNNAAAISIWSDIPQANRILPEEQIPKGVKMCLIILRTTLDITIENAQVTIAPSGFVSVIDILQMPYQQILQNGMKVVDFQITQISHEQDQIITPSDFKNFQNDDYEKLKALLTNFREYIITQWMPKSYVLLFYFYNTS